MTYPPQFGHNLKYPNQLDLDKIPVFMERSGTNPMFLEVKGLPEFLTFGKHYGVISIKDPRDSQYKLRNNSVLKFEVKDSSGTVIFSDIASSEDTKNNYSGASIFYIWVKEDPLRTYKNISNGLATLTVVGELEGVPQEWVNIPNYRCVFPIEIRTDLPNTSPILFQSSSLVSSSLTLSESIDNDNTNGTGFLRSYLNVSASNLQTFGGKVEFVELSYRDDRERNNEFQIISTYPLTSSIFEVTASSAEGLNPISDHQKVQLPPIIRRFGNIDYKIRFLNKNLEYARDINNVNSLIEITSSLPTTGSKINIDSSDGIFVTGSGGIFFGTDSNNGIKVDFSPAGSGVHKDTGNIEFKPISDGIDGKVFIIDNKGRAINSGDTNKISDEPSAPADFSSIVGASGSFISGSSEAAIIAGETNKINMSSHTAIVGGSLNTITAPVDVPGGETLAFANTMIGATEGEITASDGTTGQALWLNTIVGGQLHKIYAYNEAVGNVILGGVGNKIDHSPTTTAGPNYSAIIGGQANHVKHDNSVIIGMTQGTSSADDTVFVQNLDVAGSMTVNQLTASIISSSIMQASGSTIFGDAINDTHTFNGHITASGNIKLGGFITGSQGTVEVRGDISSSGDIYGGGSLNAQGTSGDKLSLIAGTVGIGDAQSYIVSPDKLSVIVDIADAGAGYFSIRQGGATPFNSTERFKIDGAGNISGSGTLVLGGSGSFGGANSSSAALTAQGHISSSGTLIGGGLDINGTTTFNDGHITNVGNIDVDQVRGDAANNVNIGFSTAGIVFNAEDGDKFSFNEGENNVDLLYLNSDENNFVFFDASTSKVGIGDDISQTPAKTLTVKGDISASGDLKVESHITASGNISASGNLYSPILYGSNTEILASHKPLGTNLQIYGASTIPNQYLGTSHYFDNHITASGNISSSNGNILGFNTIDATQYDVDGNQAITYNSGYRFGFQNTVPIQIGKSANPINLIGHVTASANISASGDIESKTLNVNTSAAELTASVPTTGPFNIHYGIDATATGSLSNGQGYGEIISFGIVHVSCEAGDICYNTNNIWRGADADFETSAGDVMLGVGLATGAGIPGPILIRGVVRLQAGHIVDTSGQNGDSLYLSTTTGHVQFAAPSGNTDIARIVGYCLNEDDDIIYFNPSATFVEVSA